MRKARCSFESTEYYLVDTPAPGYESSIDRPLSLSVSVVGLGINDIIIP